jgi:hypothetical protein
MPLPVRDYLYLDSNRLQDYMASIDPGALQAMKTTTRQENKSDGPDPRFGSQIIEDAIQEAVLEQTLAATDRNSFARFYDQVKSDMPSFDEYTAIDFDQAVRSSLIEVTRTFERSPLSEMIDSLLEVAELMQRMGADEQRQQAREMMSMMAFLMRDSSDENKTYPMIAEDSVGSTGIVFVAQRTSILRRVEDFDGEMTLVGKVTKKVPSGQSVDLFDLMNLFPRSIRRIKSGPKSFKELILEMFSTWPDQMGGPLPREATQISGPALVVSPLATFI